MKHHVYDKATGRLIGRSFSCSDPNDVALNIPEGHGVVQGDIDHLSQRVDLTDPQAPKVVDWRPPAPSPDHEWNSVRKRYQIKPEVQAVIDAAAAARLAIAEQESASLRAIRELLLDPNNADARVRLQAADEAIAAARPALAVAGGR